MEEESASGFISSQDCLIMLLDGYAALTSIQFWKFYGFNGLCKAWYQWYGTQIEKKFSTSFFCPPLKKYYSKHNISKKALLPLDNAPSHPANLNNLSDNVRAEFTFKNTTALLQPMDEGSYRSTTDSHFRSLQII
jgi:hypothetical protein